MFYTYNYTPVFEDYTKNGVLSLPAIVKIMENAGSAQTDSVGHCAFRENRTWAWVLTEWKVEVLSWPEYGKPITTKTWSAGLLSPLVSPREYLLYCDGVLCAKGSTRWIILDLESGRPLRINEDVLAKYEPEPLKAFEDHVLQKITAPEVFTHEYSFPVQRRDIDVNDHVHNLTYLDYAFEALPRELYRCNAFSKVRITFKKALTEEDTVVCKYGVATVEGPEGPVESHRVFIENQDGTLCTVIELQK